MFSSIVPAAISAIGSLAGGSLSAHSAASGAAEANKSNERLAKESMAFSERMSNTAFQRGVEDAHKAGLNPYITMTKGTASVPQGTVGAAQLPSAPDYGRGISSASQAGQLSFQNDLNAKQLQSTIALNAASAARVVAETKGILSDNVKKGINAGIEGSLPGVIMNYVNRILVPGSSALQLFKVGSEIKNIIQGNPTTRR